MMNVKIIWICYKKFSLHITASSKRWQLDGNNVPGFISKANKTSSYIYIQYHLKLA